LGSELRQVGKIVFPEGKIKGSARVHRWTLHADPAAFSIKARNLDKPNSEQRGRDLNLNRRSHNRFE
jgi:hypothetical protein